MKKRVSIRRSLVLNLIGVIALLSGAILLTMMLGARSAIRSLSRVVITQTIDKTEGELRHFFDPVTTELLRTRTLGKKGVLDIEDALGLRQRLAPIMRHHPHISSLMVADDAGREFMLLRTGETWRSRQTATAGTGGQSRIRSWSDAESQVIETLEALDYDPRLRPWYIGATEKWQALSAAGSEPAPADWISWTNPYKFFTTKDVGITASIRFQTPTGRQVVVGFDIMLDDIQEYADQIEVLERGQVVILTMEDTMRIVGFSVKRHFGDERSADSVLLKSPAELGIRLLEDAAKAFRSRPQAQNASGEPVRFTSASQAWWGTGKRFSLASDHGFLVTVIVPESDLLGKLQQRRAWVVGITGIVLLLGVGRALMLAHRYSEPIEALVAASDRISKGDLEPGKPVESRVSEMLQLAEAHERMRQGLATLMKLERDLQLARQIQQQTLPRRLCEVAGFDLGAWNEPAEETGGDAYDVVGYKMGPGGESVPVSAEGADRAVLLLADATGHGIGPALSVLQLRAMLRMAIHIHPDIPLIARHMNEQLCADLPDGRFITTWLGQISAVDHRLTHFSAGQAPLLHYRAAAGRVEVLSAHTVPMGLFGEIETDAVTSVDLQPGDIFAVISDGIFESTNPQGEQFETDRVSAVLAAEAAKSATDIVAALRAALNEFTHAAPADDDRTILIIKRL